MAGGNTTSLPVAAMLVQTEALGKTYGAVTVLRGLSLAVAAGERLAVLGKSGSGKSTLLHLLGGLDVPTSGRVLINGIDIGRLSRNARADYRLRHVGMVFQSFHLIPNRNAVENVELPLVFAAAARGIRRKQAEQALAAVGLSHRLQHRPGELSGGERQRVAVARALVNQPPLILADEPTGNLDSATGAEVIDILMRQVRATGAALVLVTHDQELAASVSDRVLHMQDGALI